MASAGVMRRGLALLPAATIAVGVAAAIAAGQLLPFGSAMLLVRLPSADAADAARAAAASDAALVSVPAPGFAVVYGDAARVRAALGLAIIWKGLIPCTPPP